MLNKDNYVPWSSRIIRYARSRPNGKMIVDSIENGPYVRRMIATPIEPDLPVPVPESFHEQTNKELTENDINSCETAKEIWECVRQLMKGSDIGEHEKKAKLFNEWEKFTIDKLRMLEEMVEISLDSMLDKWHRISKEIANQNRTRNVVAARDEGIGNGNQARCYNCRGLGHIARNCTARPRRRDAAYLQTQLLIAQKEEAGIQLQAKEFDFMAAAGDLDEIKEVNTNCILMANLQHASTFGTQLDKAPEEKYTDLLEPTPEPQLVLQNDNHVTSVALIDQVAQVNMVNCNMRATNAELKSELARYKIQEQRIEISQEKYDKLEKCYQKSVYKEQCLTRKINALHLSSAKQITTLNDEILLGRSCTLKRAEVYYNCVEPFKSLMCLWARSKSIAATWLEKMVMPLIVPAIKVEFRRISLTGFRSCISRSQTEASQSRQTRYE
nr:hypothetical protein [Tanacetum cinerariifolium]